MLVGPKAALRPYGAIVPAARVFALTPGAFLFVLPLSDDIHDALHAANGTGEWLIVGGSDRSLRLTTTDMAFAGRASAGSALGWIETDYSGGAGTQAGAVWTGGELTMRPSLLPDRENRPWPLRPVNAALRMLGVSATGTGLQSDEFATFGLGHYRSNEDIVREALEVRV